MLLRGAEWFCVEVLVHVYDFRSARSPSSGSCDSQLEFPAAVSLFRGLPD